MGLIVLQTDETIEPDFSVLFADQDDPIYVTRIPSGVTVTTDSLAEMEIALPAAADLLPKARPYRVVGYGCTSASSVIGSKRVEKMVQQTCDVATVTNPLRAASAYAKHLGVSKLALLPPYITCRSAVPSPSTDFRRMSSPPSVRRKKPNWCGYPQRQSSKPP